MNENTKQKLFNYSETPPASVWAGIADSLETPAFAKKLHDFEAAPPATVWLKIDRQLAQPVAAVVPLRTKLFKTAIAAAVLMALAVGALFYFKNGPGSNLAGTDQHDSSTSQKSSVAGTESSAGSKAGTTQTNNAVTESDGNAEETAMASNGRFVHFAARVPTANNPDENLATITPEEKTIIDPQLADRYMIATTATGKAVRLPKKAYSDYACAEALQNFQCKEKIAALQNKMAASEATDFTDFIDLLKKLQEAQ